MANTNICSALARLSRFLERNKASLKFRTDESWDPHFIDTHYYSVTLNGDGREFVCMNYHPYVRVLIYCEPYISSDDTCTTYLEDIHAKLTPAMARFMRHLSNLLKSTKMMLRPGMIEIDSVKVGVVMPDDTITPGVLNDAIRLLSHSMTPGDFAVFNTELQKLLDHYNVRLSLDCGSVVVTNGADKYYLT